jgi:hypothetical protein
MLAAMLPTINMKDVQAMEVLKTYWLLYPEIQKDFVHKRDLVTILEAGILTGSASPPEFTLKGRVTWVMPSSTEIGGTVMLAKHKASYQGADILKDRITDGIKEVLA